MKEPYAILIVFALLCWAIAIGVTIWPVERPKGRPKPVRHPPERVGPSTPRCPVPGCQIKKKHSHVDDLLRRMRGQ